MFTASTDKTLGIWDFETGARIKKLKGHSSFVNSCFPSRRGPQYVVSGADDCTVKVCTISELPTAQNFELLDCVSIFALCFPSVNSIKFDFELQLWDTRKRGCAQTFQNVYQVRFFFALEGCHL